MYSLKDLSEFIDFLEYEYRPASTTANLEELLQLTCTTLNVTLDEFPMDDQLLEGLRDMTGTVLRTQEKVKFFFVAYLKDYYLTLEIIEHVIADSKTYKPKN